MNELERHYNDLIKIHIFNKFYKIPMNDRFNWEQVENVYNEIMSKNEKIQEMTKDIQNHLYDLLTDEIESGSLIEKFFGDTEVSDKLNNLKVEMDNGMTKKFNNKVFKKLNESKFNIRRYNDFN